MALADDITDLEAALTAAAAANIAASSMVKLLDIALAKPVVQGRKIYASYSIGGRTVSIAHKDAVELREYYYQQAKRDEGDLVVGFAEFREAGS